MRRAMLIALLLALLAPVAHADRRADRALGDGSLVVSDASARTIAVKGTGLIFGHINQGTLTVVQYDAADTSAPQISGATPRIVGKAVVYSGSDIRFLFPNGAYSLKLDGTGIDISAVGKGTIWAFGLGTADDGSLTVGSGKPQPLTPLGVSASFGGNAFAVTATTAIAPLAPGRAHEHGG